MSNKEKEQFFQEMKVIITETVKKEIEPLKKDISELKIEMVELKEAVIPNVQKEIKSINRTVEVMEVEHGKKLDILFELLLKKT